MSFSILVENDNLISRVVLGILFIVLSYMILFYLLKTLEMGYVLKNMRPWYTHFYFFKRKLNESQQAFLKTSFPFYNRLDEKHKRYFEHRVASFIKDKSFLARDGFVITDEVKVLISATAVMLTFGFRNYCINIISKIIIYPRAYYSKLNKAQHKGEFNPRLKALVLSWDDFKKGLDIGDDNLNLGIHEFTHAIHFNSIKNRDVSAVIFSDSFNELRTLLKNKPDLRDELIASHYFRQYAFTNQFEFLAVIMETFIETPVEFKLKFPKVYDKTKQMLNFHFPGY